MNTTSKTLLASIIVVVLCFHFLWIGVYCFPQHLQSKNLAIISRLYVYPIFQQNWALFVPAPNAERKLFVRYKTESGFSSWTDILSKEIVRHKQNRLLGNEAIVLLLSNSLIYELNSLDGVPSRIYSLKKTNKEFKVLQFEVEQYLKSELKINKTTDYELLLVASAKDEKRSYYMQNLSIQ